jgi:hypothetical protein
MITPRGFAPRTPLHASAFARSATARPRLSLGVGGLSRAASPARSVRVARFAALARVFFRAALAVAPVDLTVRRRVAGPRQRALGVPLIRLQAGM